MSEKYWVGGTGNINDNTNHWSDTDGGAPGATLPGTGDNMNFTALSNATAYTVTVNATANCLDFVLGAPLTGKVTLAGSSTLNIYGSLNLSGGTAGITRTFTGQIIFKATATGKTIACNGVALASNITFNGAGGGWTNSDNMNDGTSIITLSQGAWDTNGKTITCGKFAGSDTTARGLTLGASTFNCNSAGVTAWDFTTTTNLTFDAGTSSIICAGGAAGIDFKGGGKTFYNVQISDIRSNPGTTIQGANTFNNLTILGVSGLGDNIALYANQAINGTLTITGNSAINRLFVYSDTLGTTRTITAAAVSLTNVDFQDIAGAGAAAPFTGTAIGDCGIISGITATTPVTRYWMATSGGNWNATSSWSTSDGGGTGASVPLPQDTARFTANSITSASRTITVNVPRIGICSFTGIANNPTWALTGAATTSATAELSIYGSVTLAGCTPSGTNSCRFGGRSGTNTFTSAGKTWTPPSVINMLGATFALADDFLSSSSLAVNSGTFDDNGFNVTATVITSSGSLTRSLSIDGTWTLTGTGTVWNTSTSTNLTVSGSGTIKITDTSATTNTFSGGATNFGDINIWFSRGASTAQNTLNGGFTVKDFKDDGTAAHTDRWTKSLTYTFTTFHVTGSSGNVITFDTNTAGTAATISIASGIISCDWLSIKDSAATGGATFYAGANSEDVSGNSGWIFTAPPSGGSPRAMLGVGV